MKSNINYTTIFLFMHFEKIVSTIVGPEIPLAIGIRVKIHYSDPFGAFLDLLC
jgi:hypothetical protein